MKFILNCGRVGRILFVALSFLLLTVVMFAIASVFMAYDPDGHLTRNWLHQNRWGLFGWRLAIYAGISSAWLLKVRPQIVARWPETRARLPRTEWLGVLFMLVTESVAWMSVAKGD